jgi:putative NADH-flavin reductase
VKLALLGASGQTGRLVLERALEAGHEVRALARKPGTARPGLVYVEGDAREAASIRAVAAGVDAIVSALGPTKDDTAICSRATEHVLALAKDGGPRRYLVVSGSAVEVAGDERSIGDRIFAAFVRTMIGAAFADKAREAALLGAANDVEWTLVRVPRLTDGDALGARVHATRPPGRMLRRADLAAFLVGELEARAFVRGAPFVANA